MPATSSPDNVSMEFLGPVPGVLGHRADHHVVFWVQAGGGAGFTRPSEEERDFYTQMGKPVPEWQCDYFDFDGLSWPEAALTVEFWHGSAKLRCHFLARREGRNQSDLCAELPDLKRFVDKHGLSAATMAPTFQDVLLRAAEANGIIQLGASSSGAATDPRSAKSEGAWWRRIFCHLRPQPAHRP